MANLNCSMFEDLFQTMLKVQAEMPEMMKKNHFIVIFRQKHLRPQSQATARHKWHKLIFDPNTKSLSHFFEELKRRCRTSFCTSCLRIDGEFAICQLNPTAQTVNQHSLHRNRLTRSDSRIFRKKTRIEWIRNRWRNNYPKDVNYKNASQKNSTTKR